MGDKSRETMTIQGLKQNIRQRIVAQREQLSIALRAQYSAEIAQRIVQMPEYQSARSVLAYMNFGTEFESEMFVRQVLADSKVLLLPKVNAAIRELELYRVEDMNTQLASGAYDIREPIAESCVRQDALKQVDFILLPGAAFGRDGARLGYGGGFYDKLLARMPRGAALAAGSFTMQVIANIPMEATDRKIDWLVTENETIRCASD